MRIVIAAGGTGGHIYPAIALAHEFLRQQVATSVLFIGTSRNLERKVVEREGFRLAAIGVQPVMGGGMRKALKGLSTLPRSIAQAISLLRRPRAGLVIGIGGYTSPPVLMAAWLLRIPRALVEPNACPGMANRVLSPWADRVFVAFDPTAARFPPGKTRVVGTPVRRGFFEQERAGGKTEEAHRTLLIFGGSQGARAINRAVIEALPQFRALQPPVTIIHQTGETDHAEVQEAYKKAGVVAQVVPFLFDMPAALHAADLVIARAGAVTVAELTACGKPSILVPLPQAIHAHQLRNADLLANAGAAVLIHQSQLTGSMLADTVGRMLHDQDRLREMGERSRALGRLDAAERIVQECRVLLAPQP
jgi:UDP-N-acetylglucosamine--N-acetylmuramyl-(pentapeptide) pyrophosphoryl-undecaprenol N-acetylglucosamine transferase